MSFLDDLLAPVAKERTLLTDRLNDEQRAAVYHPAVGTLIVEALAGSGKTSGVILPRCEALHEVAPGKTLVLMFGRDIREDVQQKVKTMLPSQVSNNIDVLTNHSLCLSLARSTYGRKLGLPKLVTMDMGTGLWKFNNWLKKSDPDFHRAWAPAFSDRNLRALLALEQSIEAFGVPYSPEGLASEAMVPFFDDRWSWNHAEVFDFLSSFRKRRIESGNLAFHDLLHLAAQMPSEAYARLGYRHAFVDEAQDLSIIQHAVVSKLAEATETLTMVGDAWQSIFRFNGARPDLFMNAGQMYSNAQTLPLSTNYRCDNKILEVANALLVSMGSLQQLDAGPQADLGEAYWQLPLELVPQDIFIQHTMGGVPLNEMAVLCRSNVLAFRTQLALFLADIPTRSIAKAGMDHPVVKRTLALLRVAADPGRVTLNERQEAWAAYLSNFSYLTKKLADQTFEEDPDVLLKRGRRVPGLADYQVRGLNTATDLGSELRRALTSSSPDAKLPTPLVRKIVGLVANYLENSSAKEASEEGDGEGGTNLLMALQEVLERQSIRRVMELACGDNMNTEGGVTISTVHKAKGMEWDNVWAINAGWGFLVERGLERLGNAIAKSGTPREKIWAQMEATWMDDPAMCEEGCVAYVAATRARHRYVGVITSDKDMVHLPGFAEELQNCALVIDTNILAATEMKPLVVKDDAEAEDFSLGSFFGSPAAEDDAEESTDLGSLLGVPSPAAAPAAAASAATPKPAAPPPKFTTPPPVGDDLDALMLVMDAVAQSTGEEPAKPLPVGYTDAPTPTKETPRGTRRPPRDFQLLQHSGPTTARAVGGELEFT